MSMNQQPVPVPAPMNQNEYQKIYVDTLVGKIQIAKSPFFLHVY